MGVLNFFKMADCGPTEIFKMADLFITEDLPDREVSLIKKEYCRLSVFPHSLQVTPI